eukprot:11686099-Alexandrium_andersonii.AAC.1
MNEFKVRSIVKQFHDAQCGQLGDGELRRLLTDPAIMRLSQLYKQGVVLGVETFPTASRPPRAPRSSLRSSGRSSVRSLGRRGVARRA